jgi:small GTP-binding protein
MGLIDRRVVKAVIVGDGGVGKSTFIRRILNMGIDDVRFTERGEMYRLSFGNTAVALWDIPGQERFRSLVRQWIYDYHAAILMYDVTDPTTLDKLVNWLRLLRESGRGVIHVVGNKSDLGIDVRADHLVKDWGIEGVDYVSAIRDPRERLLSIVERVVSSAQSRGLYIRDIGGALRGISRGSSQ